ncbi:MAG: hypothetical protein Q7S82_00780 [bacterium]|nr:hypothetical protein [bacterium]
MPLVVVNKNPEKIDCGLLERLVDRLPGLVASALTCEHPDGGLEAQDVEVWVQDFGPNDINTTDVEIIIWANLYPERQANLDDRREKICKGVRLILPKMIKGFVWVILNPGSFGEF